MPGPRIAIACQGGGTHAAFTAGVLAALLAPPHRGRFELAALSGTSGGAVCAALAWSGLVTRGADEAIARLEGFWSELAATEPLDALLNGWFQFALMLPVTVGANPYAYSPAAEPRLRALLERWLQLDDLPEDPSARSQPSLRIGAAEVLQGGGGVFEGESFRLEDVIASSAVPPLFRAVANRGGIWWDGLYAHNPPVAALLDLPRRPEEIWVIRLNPVTRAEEPRTTEEIEDRRNELAGNLPLDQEIAGVRLVNRLLAAEPGRGARVGYVPVTVREVALGLPALPYRSKLDRSPAHLRRLREAGWEAAERFFDEASITVRPGG